MKNLKEEIQNLEVILKELKRLHRCVPYDFVSEDLATGFWKTETELEKEIKLLKEIPHREKKLKRKD
jgi:hypothetical protein